MKRHLILSAACLALATSASFAADEPMVDFVKQIKPILADRCVECHNSETLFGELNLQNRALAFRKRFPGGHAIVAGAPEKSMLYLALTLPPKDKKAMPANDVTATLLRNRPPEPKDPSFCWFRDRNRIPFSIAF